MGLECLRPKRRVRNAYDARYDIRSYSLLMCLDPTDDSRPVRVPMITIPVREAVIRPERDPQAANKLQKKQLFTRGQFAAGPLFFQGTSRIHNKSSEIRLIDWEGADLEEKWTNFFAPWWVCGSSFYAVLDSRWRDKIRPGTRFHRIRVKSKIRKSRKRKIPLRQVLKSSLDGDKSLT